MVDQTYRIVEGIAKDVHFIPTDFSVIDMGEDEYDPPIILGRPFVSTTKAIIYIGTGEVHLHFPSEKVCHHFNDNYIVDGSKQNRMRRRCRYHNQKKQNTEDEWADYEGEVSRYKDKYPTTQVWEDKEIIAEEEAQSKAPATPSDEPQGN